MEKVEKKSYDMNLKRAIKLLNMPKDWFNTDEKIDLYYKARDYIREHKDLKNMLTSRHIRSAELEANGEAIDIYNNLVEKDEKVMEKVKKYSDETKNKSIDRGIVKIYEDEKCRKYISKYDIMYYNGPKSVAESNLRSDYTGSNCIDRFFRRKDPETGEEIDVPTSEYYIEYFSGIIENIKKEQERESKSLKNRILRFFKRDKGNKKDEKQDVIDILSNLIGQIEDVRDAKAFIDDVYEKCKNVAYNELVKDKKEASDLAKKNVIAEIGLDPQDVKLEDKIDKLIERNQTLNSPYNYRASQPISETERKELKDTKKINNYRTESKDSNDDLEL